MEVLNAIKKLNWLHAQYFFWLLLCGLKRDLPAAPMASIMQNMLQSDLLLKVIMIKQVQLLHSFYDSFIVLLAQFLSASEISMAKGSTVSAGCTLLRAMF